MPRVAVTATTVRPTGGDDVDPSAAHWRPEPLTARSARSVWGSEPTTRAGRFSPDDVMTSTFVAPLRRWAAVMMRSDLSTTPDPTGLVVSPPARTVTTLGATVMPTRSATA